MVKENDPDGVIFAAMRSEQERNKAALVLPNGPKPYYISYTIARYRHFQMAASLGGLMLSNVSPWQMSGGTQVLLVITRETVMRNIKNRSLPHNYLRRWTMM